jgi:PST family polysaccharide transporter
MDYFIVGRVLGAGPLGFYTLAFNLANYPVANFAQVLTRIVFPTFATLQGIQPTLSAST